MCIWLYCINVWLYNIYGWLYCICAWYNYIQLHEKKLKRMKTISNQIGTTPQHFSTLGGEFYGNNQAGNLTDEYIRLMNQERQQVFPSVHMVDVRKDIKDRCECSPLVGKFRNDKVGFVFCVVLVFCVAEYGLV